MSTILVSRALLYGLIFLTPFIFTTNTNEVFEFPKMYFVYFAGALLALVTSLGRLWGLRGLEQKADEEKKLCDTKPVGFTLLVGLCVASFIVSSIFSTHPYTSIWGYFSRFNGGLVSVLIFFGIYLSTLYLRPKTHDVLKTISFTLIPISIYATMQHFGFGGSWATDITVRAFSTFGQPNWYGAYCAVVLPIVLYLALENRRVKERSGWFLLFVIGFTGFWFSYSVSGILGLAVSLALVVLLNFKLTKGTWAPILAVASICLSVALVNPGIFKQKLSDALIDLRFTSPVSKDELRTKATDTTTAPQTTVLQDSQIKVSNQTAPDSLQPYQQSTPNQQPELTNYRLTDSGFIRKGIWQGAVKLWHMSPKNFLLGTGPETFPYEFQKVRPTSLNYSSEWNYILNKPHNYYLELLAQNGLIGLLCYLAIIVKVLLKKHQIFTPALVGLFVTNIFGWPTVSTTLLFWIFLALLNLDNGQIRPVNDDKSRNDYKGYDVYNTGGMSQSKDFRDVNKVSHSSQVVVPTVAYILIPILFVLIYGYLSIQFTKQYLADMYSKASDSFFESGESGKALDFSTKSVTLNPNEPFYYRQRAKTYMLTTVGQLEDRTAYIKALAYKDVVTAYDLNPQNLATLRGEIPLYYFLALKDLSATAKNQSQDAQTDPYYLQVARAYYLNLSQNYPNDVGVQTQVAKYQKMLGLLNDNKNTVSRVRILRPDLLEWYLD